MRERPYGFREIVRTFMFHSTTDTPSLYLEYWPDSFAVVVQGDLGEHVLTWQR